MMQPVHDVHQFMPQHLLAHLPMLHGAIPDAILPGSSTAFIGQAWSISLEWQFYLVAPIAFWLARNPAGALFLLVACFITVQIDWPDVRHGAFLPMHAPHFAVGAVLYCTFRTGWLRWLPRWLGRPFTVPIAQYLGRISYSVYLSHFIVITAVQALLVRFDGLSRPIHCALLIAISVPVTIVASDLLYRKIERPGIALGSRLVERSATAPTPA